MIIFNHGLIIHRITLLFGPLLLIMTGCFQNRSKRAFLGITSWFPSTNCFCISFTLFYRHFHEFHSFGGHFIQFVNQALNPYGHMKPMKHNIINLYKTYESLLKTKHSTRNTSYTFSLIMITIGNIRFLCLT